MRQKALVIFIIISQFLKLFNKFGDAFKYCILFKGFATFPYFEGGFRFIIIYVTS